LLHRQEVSQSGIVGLDPNHRITRFLEKPKPEEAFSNWVNGGIYMLEPAILDAIPADGPSDFGRDVFPMLLARGVPLFGYCLSPAEGLWWIDRPEDLARVEQDFPSTPQDADCPDPVIGDRGFSLRSLILS
jgi:NDP-sugar pyrophosphorylase family protein